MPIDYIDISGETLASISDVLEAIAGCIETQIKPNVSGARIYPYWVHEIDMQTMLGKVTSSLIASSGTSDGDVHCWTVGINETDYTRNMSGEPDIIGTDGQRIDWRLGIDVWCLRTYDGKRQSQIDFLSEIHLVEMAMFRNSNAIRDGVPKVDRVSPLRYTSIQPTPFSNGERISVAAGVMEVRVKDVLTV